MTKALGRAATIEDVARAAGVSRAAVSKVLRDAYGVSSAMREKVNAAIEELDYRPRLAARAMRGRSYTIGIEIPDFGNQFFTRVLEGASSALSESNYQLMIAPAEPGEREGFLALEALLDRQVDAMIAVSPRVAESELERIAGSTPVVMFGRHDTSEAYDTVAGNDTAGAIAIMQHLLGLGHQRIAHMSLEEPATLPGTPHGIRLKVYLEQMKAAGLSHETSITRSGDGDASAALAAAELLAGADRPTAIFAAHDTLALGALRAAMEMRIDVSVAGYDGIPIASHPRLDLTTASQPGFEMGERAARMLLERLAGRREALHEVFEPTLEVRGSTRPIV